VRIPATYRATCIYRYADGWRLKRKEEHRGECGCPLVEMNEKKDKKGRSKFVRELSFVATRVVERAKNKVQKIPRGKIRRARKSGMICGAKVQ